MYILNESEIKEIIQWLDADKDPLLVQGTESVVKGLWKRVK